MADHVDANTSKGAGKSPRVPRTSRRASTYNISTVDLTASNSGAAAGVQSTSSSSLRSVPKRKSQPNEEATSSKKLKVLEERQGRSERKSGRSLSTSNKKSSRSQSSKSSSPQRAQQSRAHKRSLRKRRSVPVSVAVSAAKERSSYSSSDDSDTFEAVTTEEEDEVEVVVLEAAAAPTRKRGRPKKVIPEVSKPNKSNNKKREEHPVSSSSNSSRARNPSGGSSGANNSRSQNRKQFSKSATSTSEATSSGSGGSGTSRGRKSHSFNRSRPHPAASATRTSDSTHQSSSSRPAAATATSTSEQTPSPSISSRLRLTPSRAAAASQRAREIASANESIENIPRVLGSSSSSGTAAPSTKSKSKSSRKESRHRGGGRVAEEESTADDSEDATASSNRLLLVEDSVDSSSTATLAAGSSSAGSSGCIFRYQLRSRASVDSASGGAGKTTHSHKPSHTNKSTTNSSSSSGGNFSGLKSILSEKERVLRRKSGGGGGGEDGGTSSSSNHKASTSSTDRGRSNSGGRGGGGGATATSNTTGSCASSRCGRGGGPSSSSEGAGGVKSGGPEGMNNLPGSSSTSNDQPNLLGVASDGLSSSSGGGAAAAGTSSGGGASSSSGGSAPRAMNSGSGGATTAAGTTGASAQSQEDTDDGEMGRLQALLESRGLPPHLFGSLAPRMQQLLHRGMSNSTVTKAQNLLQGLQASGDEGQQLQAAIEMCQLLVMGNEDTLAGFPVKQTVPALIQLLSMEHNFDIMNHACRALTYMMEALPRSTPVVAEAIPVFLEKLQSIQCMDVAEQSLTALEMLSRRHAKAILQAKGVSACLTFLDFFSIVAQRAALSVTANCCQNLHGEEFHLVKDSLKFLSERLTQQDKKSVESVCLAFSRLVDSFNTDPKRLEEMASAELLANLQQLLVVTPPVVSTGTFILVLRMLAQMCARSPNIAVKLLEHNIVGTLLSLLLGSASATADSISDDVELVARNHQELLEIVALIAELLPKLPKDGIFIVNTMMTNPQVATQDAVQWQWRDDRGNWNSYSSFDSRIIEAAHQSGEDEISLSMQSRTYTVDFLGMQQINEDTGTARSVQRKVNAFYTLKSGAPDGQEKPTVPEDERSGFLSLHPDFPLPFLRPLFALLSEANSSSAGPAVRQSCLKTLLRIVHFLPAESLQKVLKPQLVSNNLASMLGSSDLKIVVGSFQLCCLLMEKLQEDFLVHFRREGVFHQISRISSSEVVGPSPMKSDQMMAGMAGLLSGHHTPSTSSSSHLLATPSPAAAAATGPTTSSSSAAIPSSSTIAVVPLNVNNLNNVSSLSSNNSVSSGIGGGVVVGGGGVVLGQSMPILPSSSSSIPPLPSVTMNVVNVPIIPPPTILNHHHHHHLSMQQMHPQIHHHHHHNHPHPPPPPPPNSSHHTHSHSSSTGGVALSSSSSPYSICLGGFFVQQSPQQQQMQMSASANPASSTAVVLPPTTTNDLNTATPATPHHILLLPPPPHHHLADREIINVQPSSLVSLGGSSTASVAPPPVPAASSSTPLMGSITTAVAAATNIKPGSTATYEIPLPPYNPVASLLGGEGSSSAGSTSTPTPGGASSRTNTPGDKKLPDHETTQALYDAFKRKRVSKRAIPTGTSRRTRPEDVGCASTSGNAVGTAVNSSTAAAGGGPVQSAKRTGSKTGFFANLHPSRWTRGSSGSGGSNSVGNNSTPSSSSNNNNNNNNSTPGSGGSQQQQNAALHLHYTQLHGHSHPHGGGSPHVVGGMSIGNNPSSSRNNSFNVSYKEQVKAWLKEQSTAFTSKYCTNKTAGGDGNAAAVGGAGGKHGNSGGANLSGCSDGVEILPKLAEIINCLRQESKMTETLKELRTIVMESDISSFEVNHSGLIGALLAFLTDENGYKTPRESRLRSFIHVFADCPIDRLCGDELDSHNNGNGATRSGTGSALSCLVAKLNSCLSQLEQFQVKVHEVPTSSTGTRAAPTSALRFFNTHQIKCNLQRHPGCTTLRQWKGGPVKIDSLALVQTIERYLIAKGFSRVRESRDSGDSEDDNSDDDIDDTLAAAVISQGNARHKLQFLIGEQILPYNMTVYQAIRQFGSGGSDPNAELEADFDPASALLGSSGLWAQTHTIYYRPVPDESAGGGSAASGSSAVGSTSSSAKKKSKSLTASAKNSSKSKKDPLWHEGILPEPTPPYLSYLSNKLPDSVSVSDPCLPVLTLLRVIHSVCRYWRYLYWPVISDKPLLPPSEFINTKVAAKAQRQLQDPVVIMTGNVPQWLQQIGAACPFLFPFETRQMLFYSVTFDRDRALQRLLDSVPELNSTEREDRVTPRLDRRKRTISRDNILSHAEQLMNDFGSSRPLLEIQYENEVGTGLGPTLEFYALVSQELQKKELDLWHSESSIGGDSISSEDNLGDGNSNKKGGKGYVINGVGLFPKPLGKSVKAGHVSKVRTKFKFMGKFMAKAVMDSRMIDLPLSKTLYKWVLDGEGSSMCLADILEVDSTVARSIRQLVGVVSQKKKLEARSAASGSDLNAALESLTLDGCRIDNLGLDFTLPGHPSIDLKKGGKDIPVTIHNLEDYVKLVCHWMLVSGVGRQMEAWKEGFDSVFNSASLRMFYPEELEMVFCGSNQSSNESWDVKTLMECCRADHGFTLESKAIQSLFQIMASYNGQERRKFVQFVTGSPRLPVGGFKSLQPPLTIVRKTVDGLPSETDSYLPSVMTCVNYLKLPDYSSTEVMRDRLKVAVDEGQLSFHLS